MNILVYDVAASEGGALTVLNDFLLEVRNHKEKDTKWFFLVSTPQLDAPQNVEILSFPWVKKSWLHRIWFEHVICPRIVRQLHVDLVLSLQNIIIPHIDLPQILYVHQPLPFVSYRFKFTENHHFWIYQNIIGKMIVQSIRRADKVIVQTQWMKQACLKQTGVTADKIAIIPPKINIDKVPIYQDSLDYRKVFFYPSGVYEYKNHNLIIQACSLLQSRGIDDYQVIFTLSGKENAYTKQLLNRVEASKLNICFKGSLKREEVFALYRQSVLLFPSLIETFGLPLLEAKTLGCIILAADMPFGQEILRGYPNVRFYDGKDPQKLAQDMSDCISGKLEYKSYKDNSFVELNSLSMVEYILTQSICLDVTK